MTKPGCQQYPDCECPYDFACVDDPRKTGCWPMLLIVGGAWLVFIAIAWVFIWTTRAEAHDALPTAAQPQGWKYPFSCCSGYDCRPVKATTGAPLKLFNNLPTVAETPEGYKISTTGEIVGYGDSRLKNSPDQDFHWCSVAGASDGRTICLFVPPRSF